MLSVLSALSARKSFLKAGGAACGDCAAPQHDCASHARTHCTTASWPNTPPYCHRRLTSSPCAASR
eukprot:9851900-Alexandrium_andersonii.AAC.1